MGSLEHPLQAAGKGQTSVSALIMIEGVRPEAGALTIMLPA